MTRIIILIIAIMVSSPVAGESESGFVINKPTYDLEDLLAEENARQEERIKRMEAAHKARVDELSNRHDELAKERAKLEDRLEFLRGDRTGVMASTVAVQVLQRGFSWALFPVQSVFALLSNKLMLIFFPITVLGLIAFTHSKYSMVAARYRTLVTVSLFLALALFFAPNVAEAQEKTPEFEQTLDRTNELLRLNDVQRYIQLLEDRSQDPVTMPSLQVSHQSLMVFQKISPGEISYEESLAALHHANGSRGKAVDIIVGALSGVTETQMPNEQEFDAAIRGIEYLIEQRQRTDAARTIEDVSAAAGSYERLYRVLKLARANDMLESYNAALEHYSLRAQEERSVRGLLTAGSYAEKLGETRTAEQLLALAEERARSDEELYYLARFHQDRSETDKAAEIYIALLDSEPESSIVKEIYSAAGRAGPSAISGRALEVLLNRLSVNDDSFSRFFRDALENDYSAAVSVGIQRIYETYGFSEEYQLFIDELLTHDKVDYIRQAYEVALENVKVTEHNGEVQMRAILDSAIANNVLDIASKATLKLAIHLSDRARDYGVEPPGILYPKNSLPVTDDLVDLEVLYGILNEKLGFLDKAKEAYMGAVLRKLEDINAQYASEVRPDLNDLYYLQKYLVKIDDRGTFEKLQPVVEAMITVYERNAEERDAVVVRRLQEENEDEIEALRQTKEKEIASMEAQIDSDKKAIDRYSSQIESTREDISAARVSLYLESARLSGLVIVAGLVFGGVLLQGKRYASRWDHNKYFAFIAKVIESYGFFCFISVINLVPGILLTFTGQWLIIYQLKHSEGEADRLRPTPIQGQ